jgi:hypothetical protein
VELRAELLSCSSVMPVMSIGRFGAPEKSASCGIGSPPAAREVCTWPA